MPQEKREREWGRKKEQKSVIFVPFQLFKKLKKS